MYLHKELHHLIPEGEKNITIGKYTFQRGGVRPDPADPVLVVRGTWFCGIATYSHNTWVHKRYPAVLETLEDVEWYLGKALCESYNPDWSLKENWNHAETDDKKYALYTLMRAGVIFEQRIVSIVELTFKEVVESMVNIT